MNILSFNVSLVVMFGPLGLLHSFLLYRNECKRTVSIYMNIMLVPLGGSSMAGINV